jgi:hypothetical protein
MAFFARYSLQSFWNVSTINVSNIERMSRSAVVDVQERNEVRLRLDELFKEVESRQQQVEMVALPAGDHQDEDEDENDWSTVASDDEDTEEQEEEEVAEPAAPQCDCHETTAQPIFALPEGFSLGECPICYDDIKMVNMTVSRCGHIFHASCIFACLEHRIDCPMCRTQLINEVYETDEEDE